MVRVVTFACASRRPPPWPAAPLPSARRRRPGRSRPPSFCAARAARTARREFVARPLLLFGLAQPVVLLRRRQPGHLGVVGEAEAVAPAWCSNRRATQRVVAQVWWSSPVRLNASLYRRHPQVLAVDQPVGEPPRRGSSPARADWPRSAPRTAPAGSAGRPSPTSGPWPAIPRRTGPRPVARARRRCPPASSCTCSRFSQRPSPRHLPTLSVFPVRGPRSVPPPWPRAGSWGAGRSNCSRQCSRHSALAASPKPPASPQAPRRTPATGSAAPRR